MSSKSLDDIFGRYDVTTHPETRALLRAAIKELVLGVINETNLLKMRESTGQKIWVDRDELCKAVEAM